MSRRDVAALAALATSLAGALPACSRADEPASAGHAEAARIEVVDGARSRVTLTPRAVERLGLQTAAVRASTAAGRSGRVRLSVPYAAVVFTADGRPWTYTAHPGHSFLRERLAVDSVHGDLALLTEGPPVGSRVVTAGAAELFGTEFDVGH